MKTKAVGRLRWFCAILIFSIAQVTASTTDGGSATTGGDAGTQPVSDAYFAGYEITQDEPGLTNTLLEVILGTCDPDHVYNLYHWLGYISVTGTFSDESGGSIGGPISIATDLNFPEDVLDLDPLKPGRSFEYFTRRFTLTGTWVPVPECPFRITNDIELTLTLDKKRKTMRMVGRSLSGTQCPCVGPCYPAFAAMGPFDVEVPLHPAECSYIKKLMKDRPGR